MNAAEVESNEGLTEAPVGRAVTPAVDDIEKFLLGLFPPLERHQRKALRRAIEAGEVVPRVVVWKGTGLVVDGRETKRICDRLGKPFETEERDFDDLEAVVRWRIEAQLLRRNLTPVASSYYRGRHYLSLACQGRRTDLTSRHTGEMSAGKLLGRLYGVGARTIERDAALCKALDSIAEKQATEVLDPLFDDGFILGTDYRGSVLSGRIRPPRTEVMELARMREGEMNRSIRDMLAGRKKPRRKEATPAPGQEAGSPPVLDDGPPAPEAGTAVPATHPAVTSTMAAGGPDRCEGVDSEAGGPRPAPESDDTAVDESGLVEINRVWGGLNEATRLAFLRQDAVSKQISGAGFVRLDRPRGERRSA